MHSMNWLCCLALLVASRLALAENIVVHSTYTLQDSTLVLDSANLETRVVQGDWRFSENANPSVTEQNFASYSLLNPLSGNFFYIGYQRLPEQGSFYLKIEADRDQELALMFGGLVAESYFTLEHGANHSIIYTSPEYLSPKNSNGRVQVPYPFFTIKVVAGTSFLGYHYKQKFQKKGNEYLVNAGLVGPMYIGTHDRLWQRFHFKELFLKIPVGIFFCLFIYSSLIYFSRGREDRESLILAVLNGTTFFREILSETIILNFIPTNPWLLDLHAFSFGLPLFTTAISVHFLQTKVQSNFLRVLKLIFLVNFALLTINTMISIHSEALPDTAGWSTLFIMINASLFFLAFMPYAIWKGAQIKSTELTIFAIGICFIGLGTFIDFLNSAGNHGWPWVSMWGGVIFSILLAKNNSRMFAKAFDSSIKLNRELQEKNEGIAGMNLDLERKVQERTSKIKALLEYIPQGVLSIGGGGLIDANFSSQLPKLLDHDSIANQSFLQVFIQQLELSQDEKDQIWQSINATIGDSVIGFEMNTSNFPLEVIYKTKSVRRHMRLTWNIEVDEVGLVKRILVTILDVSQEVSAKRELDEKNRDLDIIKQLAEISHKKIQQFFASGIELLQENVDLIAGRKLEKDDIKILFVNMHTIKGAARTLQLKQLSHLFHEIESHYAAILKKQEVLQLDLLASDISRAKAAFEHYQKINREVLGRDHDLTKIQIDREFLEEHCGLLYRISEVGQLPADIKGIIHKNRHQLTQMIFLSLHNVLQDIMSHVEKIALDLGKETPDIEWDVHDCLISHKQETLLKNSFLHLIRNAIDHGIELSEERLKLGKSRCGNLKIKAGVVNGQICIEFQDDGRGLAMTRLKERGIALGVLNRTSSPQEIAETIFDQGVSTAKQVTQISGRGVGMGAARRFFEAESGDIQLVLLDDSSKLNDYCPFKIVMLLEAQEMILDTVA